MKLRIKDTGKKNLFQCAYSETGKLTNYYIDSGEPDMPVLGVLKHGEQVMVKIIHPRIGSLNVLLPMENAEFVREEGDH